MKNFSKKNLCEAVTLSIFFLSIQASCLANENQQDNKSAAGGSWYSDLWSKAKSIRSSFGLEKETDRDAVFMSLPRYKRPSERVIEGLSGGDYLGRSSRTGEPCLLTDDEDALAVFSNLSPCLMNNLYTENFDEEIATHFNGEVSKIYDGRPPQAFSLKLEPEGTDEFCQCTMVKKNMMNLRPTVVGPDGEKIGRRREILNNLARDGMKKIYDKLLKIQKPVAYAMSSREMSGFTGKSTSEKESKGKIEASTSLALCMPSEMLKTLAENSKTSERLCGATGVRRLASGMKKGKTFDCVGPEVGPSLPHCYSDPMNSMKVQGSDDILEEISRGIQMQTGGRGDIKGLQNVLERHNKMAETSYSGREFSNTRRGRRVANQNKSGQLDFSEFKSSQHGLGYLKRGEYSEELMKKINVSLQAELSEQGNKLWQRNVKPFQDAFESAVSNSGKVSEATLDGIDINYLRKYLTVNPYLEKRLASNSGFTIEELQSIDKENLKSAIQTYVEEDMYRVYLALQSPDDYEMANIMGFTYGPDYYETLNKCEEIQKTMISLCRALDQDEGEESLARVFTDSRLMALYAEDLEDIYKGEAELGHYSEFEAASYLFCEETQKDEDSVDKMNQAQMKLERELAVHDIFLQMESEKKILHQLAENDKVIAQKVAQKVQETQRVISANPKRYEVINAQRVVERASEESQNVRSGPSQRVSDRVVSNSPGSSQSQIKEGVIVQPSDEEKTSGVTEETSTASSEGSTSQRSTNPSPKKFNRFQESFKYDFDSSVGMNEEADDEANNLPIDEQNSDGRVQQGVSPRDSNASSLEEELMRELEEMRARESELTAKLDELSEKLEEDKKQEELKEKNEEVDELKEQMRELKEELAVVRAQKDQKNEGRSPAIVRPSENKGLFGPSSTPRSTARTNQNTATTSGSTKRTTRSTAPEGQDSTRSKVASTDSSQFPSSAMLTGRTSKPSVKVRLPQNTKIAPHDMSLTSLALNAQGNIALRETNNPGVLERVIFKTQNGEIVYENGYPVIDKRETVSVEEGQEIAELIPVPEEATGREPASIEEELLEIERELRPRASHQKLIETLQQNTEN